MWQNPADRQCRVLDHASGTAARAESAHLAAQSEQLPRVARLEACTQEAVLPAATSQVGVELLLDEFGQLYVIPREVSTKIAEVFLNDLVEQRAPCFLRCNPRRDSQRMTATDSR